MSFLLRVETVEQDFIARAVVSRIVTQAEAKATETVFELPYRRRTGMFDGLLTLPGIQYSM